MKKKNLIGLVSIIICIMLFAVGSAIAASHMYTCNVIFSGVASTAGQFYVKLTHVPTTGAPAFKNQWWRVDPDNAKAMLAVILTAQSMGKTVDVYLDETYIGTHYSVIKAIYLNSD